MKEIVYGVQKPDGTLYPVAAPTEAEALRLASSIGREKGGKSATAIGKLLMAGARVVPVAITPAE